VILRIFLKFSKRRHAVPLRPIWTIMVATKLDHSRVLVTKFRENWLTLKCRSASQRHTDRQTNSAENKGPSGLQSGQKNVCSYNSLMWVKGIFAGHSNKQARYDGQDKDPVSMPLAMHSVHTPTATRPQKYWTLLPFSQCCKVNQNVHIFLHCHKPQPFYGPFSGTTQVSRCQKRTS